MIVEYTSFYSSFVIAAIYWGYHIIYISSQNNTNSNTDIHVIIPITHITSLFYHPNNCDMLYSIVPMKQ